MSSISSTLSLIEVVLKFWYEPHLFRVLVFGWIGDESEWRRNSSMDVLKSVSKELYPLKVFLHRLPGGPNPPWLELQGKSNNWVTKKSGTGTVNYTRVRSPIPIGKSRVQVTGVRGRTGLESKVVEVDSVTGAPKAMSKFKITFLNQFRLKVIRPRVARWLMTLSVGSDPKISWVLRSRFCTIVESIATFVVRLVGREGSGTFSSPYVF